MGGSRYGPGLGAVEKERLGAGGLDPLRAIFSARGVELAAGEANRGGGMSGMGLWDGDVGGGVGVGCWLL